MINLLPESGKKLVRREYLMRVGAVWALVLALAIIASALMLIPGYVLVRQELSLHKGAETASDEAYTLVSEELASAQTIADRLNMTETKVPVSVALRHLEDALTTDIGLQGIELSETETSLSVRMTGTAKTRDALTSFTARLEADPLIENVDVPVSNLARDVDLGFSMTLSVRPTP